MADSRFFHNLGPFTLDDIANASGVRVMEGHDGMRKIYDVSPLETAQESDLSFLDNVRYSDAFSKSRAGACIIRERFIEKAPPGMALIISDNPYHTYAVAASMFYPSVLPSENNIHPSAMLDENASIGKKCHIGAHVVVGKNAHIGDECIIHAGVVIGDGVVVGNRCIIHSNSSISHAVIGNNVRIHQGVCIGQDGFGFATDQYGVHRRVPQLGRVIIEDGVDIGAGTCIDRGTGPDTRIGEGTMIDNLVQIGHNVQLGKGCVVVAQVGISGSTKIGNHVIIGGQAGITGHLYIGDGVQVAAQSGVMRDVEKGEILGGSPAVPIKQYHRQTVALQKLVNSKKQDKA